MEMCFDFICVNDVYWGFVDKYICWQFEFFDIF